MSLESEIKKQKAKNSELQKKGQPQRVYNLIKEKPHFDDPPKGDRFSVCQLCGKQFEQNLSEERNVYSSFKTCPACRKKVSQEKTEEFRKEQEREVAVASLPYNPYPWQVEAHEAFENHRFIVLACGNRSGKDRFSMMALIRYFVECLNENRAIDHPDMVPSVYAWLLAPTERLAKQNWRELKQFFPKQWVVACSDSNYQMETVGGGIIEVRSAYSPSELVGVGLDIIVATEASQFKDLGLAWANLEARLNSPGRGREKDRCGKRYGQGKAIINSTPDPNNSKNFFYEMFCYGQPTSDLYSSLWWSKQFPWTCNPANEELAKSIVHSKYGDITYEENLRRRIGERNYRTLYLADFNAATGSVFNNFDSNCVVNPFVGELATDSAKRKEFIDNWKRVKPMHEYVGAYDPATGSSGDSPAFVIRDKTTNEITRVYDLYGKSYEAQWDFIATICKMFNNAPIYWLRTGHTAIEGQFEKRGVKEVPIDENGTNKAKLVQNLVLAVENNDIHILNDNTIETQTLIFQMQDYTETNGKFSNKSQPHDDFVSALYASYYDYVAIDAPVFYCGMMGGI